MKSVKFVFILIMTIIFSGSVALSGCQTVDSYGNLSITDVYAWIDYPSTQFNAVFDNPDKAEPLTYSYDNTAIEIDEENNTVKALKTGTFKVEVKSEHFSTSFNVYCERVDRSNEVFAVDSVWWNRVDGFKKEWQDKGHEGRTTLFIGDSFFDSQSFWKTFYDDYSSFDALCWGIGSTTTYTWEVLTDSLLKDCVAKNIVMHCGTNTVYDDRSSAEETISSLQRMFTLMHDRLPDTKIYWFTITHRIYDGAEELYPIVEKANQAMIDWAKGKDWLVVIDSNPNIKYWHILPDGIHPNADGYGVFMDMLSASDIEMASAIN